MSDNKQNIEEVKGVLDSVLSDSSNALKISKTYEKIREIWFSRKYGFSSSKKHAKELYEISDTPLFQQFGKCVAIPIYATLVRDGLRISYLNDEGRRKEIEEIRKEARKKYGMRAIKILNISSTGELQRIVEYLIDLKIKKNYNIFDLTKEFEKILDNWEKITLFIKSEDDINHILKEVNWHIEQKQELFFIFAYGSAIQHAIEAIANLNNDGLFKNNNYLFESKIDVDKANKEKYKCIFERIITC